MGRPKLALATAIAALALVQPPILAQNSPPPVFDGHQHLSLTESDAVAPSHSQGTDALDALNARAGVTRSALIVMAGGGPAAVRAENDALLATVARHPERFVAIASVHPADGDAAITELERLASHGVRFIKLHPNSQEFDIADAAVSRITQRCGELGMTVLIDSYDPFDPAQIGKLLRLTMAQPGTRFILAHMGLVRFRETMVFSLIGRMGAPRNVWFDTSAIATTFAGGPVQAELVWTMRQIGMDRMIFGSDWPVDTPARALAAVRGLGLTPAEERLVLHDNFAALAAAPIN